METRRLTDKADSTLTTEVSVDAPNRLLCDGVRDELDEMFQKMPLSSNSTFLDDGCGKGPVLVRAAHFAPHLVVGLDVNPASLLEAQAALKSSNQRYLLVQGDMHNLPFKPEVFSHLCCRVALPYVDQEGAISEIGRVLKRGGWVFLQLHSYQFYLRLLIKEFLNWKRIIMNSFCLVNGLVFYLAGRQLSLRAKSSYRELFQTVSGMRRLLRTVQIETLWIENSKLFRVLGKKGVL